MARPIAELIVLVALTAGCAASDAGCATELGSTPPSTITVTGASAASVGYSAWECPGYNAEGAPTEVLVSPRSGGVLTIDAGPMGTDPVTEFRFHGQDGSEESRSLDIGGPWTVAVTGTGTMTVRPCTGDGRCAIYEFRVAEPPEVRAGPADRLA